MYSVYGVYILKRVSLQYHTHIPASSGFRNSNSWMLLEGARTSHCSARAPPAQRALSLTRLYNNARSLISNTLVLQRTSNPRSPATTTGARLAPNGTRRRLRRHG